MKRCTKLKGADAAGGIGVWTWDFFSAWILVIGVFIPVFGAWGLVFSSWSFHSYLIASIDSTLTAWLRVPKSTAVRPVSALGGFGGAAEVGQ